MRKKATGFVKVRAISGTHVVFLAFDMQETDTKGLLGFAIQRYDLVENETIWLRGNKTFPSIRASAGLEDASSHEHPFQAFQWADYSVKPGQRYRYTVVPMTGTPGRLSEKPATRITIDTEPLAAKDHEVFFNRGALASQAFARRFPGKTLEQAGELGYTWLTRDLLPGMLAFIAQAAKPGYALRAAFYELGVPEVLQALKQAAQSGADVKILYHGKDDDTGNDNALLLSGDHALAALCAPRGHAKLMHNKFMVLLKKGKPVSVWTGSTNLSTNALYGQLNVGHSIHNAAAAKRFLDYWGALANDPAPEPLKAWVDDNNPVPTVNETTTLSCTFSPHSGRAVLDEWLALADVAKPLFMTFPFGMGADFRKVYDRQDGVLRFALLDKLVNGGTQQSRAAAIADTERIRALPNIEMAVGNRIFVDWVDGWYQEATPIGRHVDWVHTKFMLLDPLGSHPVTLSGSANWSLASVNQNDENMVLVRGNTRVADIFFGEFMRVFAHHRFRESVARHAAKYGKAASANWKPQDLAEDWRAWVPPHFKAGSTHDLKRKYFYGA